MMDIRHRYFESALNGVRYVYGRPIRYTRKVAENMAAGREPLDDGPSEAGSKHHLETNE